MQFKEGQLVSLEGRKYTVILQDAEGRLHLELKDWGDSAYIWDRVDGYERSTHNEYIVIYPEAVHLFKPVVDNNHDGLKLLRRD